MFFKRLKETIATIREKDPAARGITEVLLCYPGLHALAIYELSSCFWRHRLYFIARLLSHIAKIITGVEIHPAATIGRRFFIDHATGVVIGETAEIGNDVTLYQGVTLGGTSTVHDDGSLNCGKRHPTLGNGVIVGAGAQVLGPITIGEHARIGSNAVVLKNVDPHNTVVGIPARPVTPRRRKKTEDAFSAYGYDATSASLPDPLKPIIEGLEKKIATLSKEVAALTDEAAQKFPKAAPKKTRKKSAAHKAKKAEKQ